MVGRAGLPLDLRGFQRRLYLETFARDPVTRRRLHRTALWLEGRKNGKTAGVVPVALKGLMLEGDGAEVYCAANDREQAKFIFAPVRRTVEMVPELNGRLKLYRDAIEDPVTGSILRALSAEAYTKEGLSPTLVLYDEPHAARNPDLYNVLALAMGARLDPLMLLISTAGVRTDITGQDSILYTLYQYGLRVVSGEVIDPSFYMACWEADPSLPLDSVLGFRQGNPGYGDILDADEIANQARKALSGGMSEAEFRIKRLNQWVNSDRSWFAGGLFEKRHSERPEVLPANEDRPVPSRLLKGEPIVVFFDGSFNHDCTVLVACALDGYEEVVGYWGRPADTVDWEVPIAEVDARVMSLGARYKLLELAADPFRWAREMQMWAAAGVPVVEFPTTSAARMVPACAKFFDAVVDGRLTHSGDPRLIRHVNNAVVKVDHIGPRIVKDHRNSSRSIDLAVAAVGAYDRATFHAGGPKRAGAFLV